MNLDKYDLKNIPFHERESVASGASFSLKLNKILQFQFNYLSTNCDFCTEKSFWKADPLSAFSCHACLIKCWEVTFGILEVPVCIVSDNLYRLKIG